MQLGFTYRFHLKPRTPGSAPDSAPEFKASDEERAAFEARLARMKPAGKPTKRRHAYRVTRALELHGDRVLRAPDPAAALTGLRTVRIYYHSFGGEILYFEETLGWHAAESLHHDYRRIPEYRHGDRPMWSSSAAVDSQIWGDAKHPHAPSVLFGARMVTLPSQVRPNVIRIDESIESPDTALPLAA